MKKKEITVIYKEPGRDPVEVTVPNELRQFQSMVGGYIETVPFTREILLLCDEEGRLKMKTRTSCCAVTLSSARSCSWAWTRTTSRTAR